MSVHPYTEVHVCIYKCNAYMYVCLHSKVSAYYLSTKHSLSISFHSLFLLLSFSSPPFLSLLRWISLKLEFWRLRDPCKTTHPSGEVMMWERLEGREGHPVGWRKENRLDRGSAGCLARVGWEQGWGEGYLWVLSADASAFHLWVGWEFGRGACESWVFSVIFSFLTEGRKQPISPGLHHSDSLGPA